VILEGRIQIYLESSEGRSAVLRVLEAGEFFGEMALLDGGARSANALALEPSELFVLHRTSFLDLVTTSPEMLTRLLAGLTERLRNTDERYLTQMLAGVTQELNAPLDAISANAGAIRRDLTTEAATTLPRELADRMWKAAGAIEKDSAHAHELLRKLSSRSS
jgi:CRP-like cAMP-binding protein